MRSSVFTYWRPAHWDQTSPVTLLLVFGMLSVVIAVPFILVQHDLKRLLAYSSVEHIGIIALGVGIGGPLALFAAAFHMLNHALTKAVLFFAAGRLGQHYGNAAPLPPARGGAGGAAGLRSGG